MCAILAQEIYQHDFKYGRYLLVMVTNSILFKDLYSRLKFKSLQKYEKKKIILMYNSMHSDCSTIFICIVFIIIILLLFINKLNVYLRCLFFINVNNF